jgi:hypothetical protein
MFLLWKDKKEQEARDRAAVAQAIADRAHE